MKNAQRHTLFTGAGLLSLALAACGGGGGTTPATVPTRLTAPTQPQSVVVSISIPSRSSAAKRAPQYISPGTATMQVAVSPGPGVVAPSPSSTTVPCSGSTCTATVGAYPGQNTFTVNLYDGNSPATLLSTATHTATIAAGMNAINLSFGGVPASVTLTASPANFTSGTAGSSTLTVSAVDADGYLISGTYASPIPLTVTPTGYVTLSPTSVASSTQTVTATYNGAPVTCSFTGLSIGATNGFGITGPAGGLMINASGCSAGITISPSSSITLAVGSTQTVTLSESGYTGSFSIQQPDACTGAGYVTVTQINGTTFNIQGAAPTVPTPCAIVFQDASSPVNSSTLTVSVQ